MSEHPVEPPAYPPVPSTPGRRSRPALRVAGVVWAVLLVVVAAWYSFHGRPSVREQTTVEQASAAVDRGIAAVLAAAGSPTVAISGYDRVGGCALTAARTGASYRREAWLYTRNGGEAALLARVATKLPKSYHARPVRSGAVPPQLVADAGDYVALTGAPILPGVVQVVADTGCRPVSVVPAADPTGAPGGGDQAVLQAVLARLGASAAAWSSHQLSCGAATVRTVEVDSQSGVQPGPLNQALQGFGTALVAQQAVYATTDGLAVRNTGDRIVVTSTTGSCG